MTLKELDDKVKEGYELLKRATSYREYESLSDEYFQAPVRFEEGEQLKVYCDIVARGNKHHFECYKVTADYRLDRVPIDSFYTIDVLDSDRVVASGKRLIANVEHQDCVAMENHLMKRHKVKRHLLCKRR